MIFGILRVRRLVAAVAVLLFLCSSSLISQVTIREKAVITAIRAPVAATTAPVPSATILTVGISFTGGIKNEPNTPHVFSMIDPCGVRTEGNFGGSLTFDFPALGGVAQARAIFYPSSPGQTTVRWRVDGVEVSSSTSDVNCTNCRIDLQPYFTLYPGYTFSRTWEGIRHGQSNFFSARAIDRFDFCQAPVWNPAFGITLNISRGSQYGEFVDAAGQSLGTTTTVTSEELASIRYAANGVQPEGVLDTVEVHASSAGIEGTVRFTVRNTTLHLEPSPPHDVHAGEWTSVDAQATDVQGNAAAAPEGVTCTFEIVAGGTWATLVDDASGQRGSILSGIVFKAGRAGVMVEASTQEPATPQEVRVSITASDPEIAGTQAAVRVIPHELVLIATPSTVAQGGEAQLEVKLRLPDGSLGDVGPDNNIFFYISSYPSLDTLVSADGSQRDVFVWGDQPRATFLATADTSRPDSDNVVIVAGANEGSGRGTVLVVKKTELDHFEVRVEKDTVAFTESSKIFVQAKDANNQDIDLDPSTLLRFSLLGESVYGTFIKPNGDTLKTTPVELEDIRYDDAKAGKVVFAAVVKNPETIAKPNIVVTLQSDPSKKGEREIVVLEQTLRIVMNEPREVRPSIPTEDNRAALVQQRRKSFEVVMTRGGKPVANHPFRLRTDYVRGSGGHDHGDTPTVVRADNHDNYGFFTAGQANTPRRPLDDVTDADGKFAVTYNASIFGDSMKIYLKSRDPIKAEFFQDSVTIVEKVAGLINFRDVESGGRWTFAQSTTGETRHPNNNCCDQGFSDSVRLAIEDFHEWTLSDRGGGRAVVISLNDMSLPFGGRFDISARWDGRNDQRHRFHRVGTSADVNQTLSATQLDKLTTFMARRGLLRNQERPEIHYGSDGGN